jgi:hypothetical protein
MNRTERDIKETRQRHRLRQTDGRRNGAARKAGIAINHDVHTDRAANGGKLTAAEHKQVNQ